MFRREDLEQRLKELFAKSLEGDQKSYEEFLGLCQSLARSYLFKLGGKHVETETLEDILQEVLLGLHQKKHTYRTDRAFLPWLYSVIRYRYIDFYRSRKRNQETLSFEETEFLHGKEQSHELLDVEELMSHLTDKQKEMLYLVKVEGSTYAEAAKELSMSVPAVKVGVHRIVKFLKGIK